VWSFCLSCQFCLSFCLSCFFLSFQFWSVILFVMFLSFVLSSFCHLSFGLSFCSSLFVISVKFIGDIFFYVCVIVCHVFFFQMLYFYLFLVVACESLQLRCELVRGSWPLCLACGMLAHTSKSVTAMDVVYLLQVMYAIQCPVFKRMYCI